MRCRVQGTLKVSPVVASAAPPRWSRMSSEPMTRVLVRGLGPMVQQMGRPTAQRRAALRFPFMLMAAATRGRVTFSVGLSRRRSRDIVADMRTSLSTSRDANMSELAITRATYEPTRHKPRPGSSQRSWAAPGGSRGAARVYRRDPAPPALRYIKKSPI